MVNRVYEGVVCGLMAKLCCLCGIMAQTVLFVCTDCIVCVDSWRMTREGLPNGGDPWRGARERARVPMRLPMDPRGEQGKP